LDEIHETLTTAPDGSKTGVFEIAKYKLELLFNESILCDALNNSILYQN